MRWKGLRYHNRVPSSSSSVADRCVVDGAFLLHAPDLAVVDGLPVDVQPITHRQERRLNASMRQHGHRCKCTDGKAGRAMTNLHDRGNGAVSSRSDVQQQVASVSNATNEQIQQLLRRVVGRGRSIAIETIRMDIDSATTCEPHHINVSFSTVLSSSEQTCSLPTCD